MKKHQQQVSLELERNTDIIREVASMRDRPFVVGFAAETDDVEDNARKKLVDKSLDMIAANQVGSTGENGKVIGFNSDFNSLHVIWPDGEIVLPIARKNVIAKQLIEMISQHYRTELTNRQHTA